MTLLEHRGEAASIAADLATVSFRAALRDMAAAVGARSPARRRELWARAAAAFRRASRTLAEAGDHAERRAREG